MKPRRTDTPDEGGVSRGLLESLRIINETWRAAEPRETNVIPFRRKDRERRTEPDDLTPPPRPAA